MDKMIDNFDKFFQKVNSNKVVISIRNFIKKTKELIDDIKKKKWFILISKPLRYISKVLSAAAIVLLVIVGAFLLYYVVTSKMYANNSGYRPKVSLFTIVSGSMEPVISVYDVVMTIAVENPQDINVGDIITFYSTSSISEGLVVTHRVTDVKIVNGQYQYVTKGDYNATADTSTATYDNVIGKVSLKIPQLGRIQFFVSSRLGWFVVVLLPAMGVIVYDILKLIKLLIAKTDSDKVVSSKPVETTGDIEIDEAIELVKKNDYINRLNDLQTNNAENIELPKLNVEPEKDNNINVQNSDKIREKLLNKLNNSQSK